MRLTKQWKKRIKEWKEQERLLLDPLCWFIYSVLDDDFKEDGKELTLQRIGWLIDHLKSYKK